MTPLQTAELHGLYIHGDYGRDDVASGAESSRKKWLDPEFHLTSWRICCLKMIMPAPLLVDESDTPG